MGNIFYLFFIKPYSKFFKNIDFGSRLVTYPSSTTY